MFYCTTCKRDKPDKDKIKKNRYRVICRDCFLKLSEKAKAKVSYYNWQEGLGDK